MKRNVSMRLHFALLGLAIALTGCPNPGPETGGNPDSSPTPTPSPSGSSDEEQPTPEVKTLGLVKATLTGSSFVLGAPAYDVHLGNLGMLAAKADMPPAFSSFYKFPHSDEFPESYALVDEATHTHTFVRVLPEDVYQDVGFTLGGQPATRRVLNGNLVRVSFPADAEGELTVTRPADSSLLFWKQHMVAINPFESLAHHTFEPSLIIPADEVEWMAVHAATASLTVSVSELTGEPSTGLSAAHFSLATANTGLYPIPLKGKIVAVTETEPGVYAVTGTFEGLNGRGAVARKLTLLVGNPTLHTEVKP